MAPKSIAKKAKIPEGPATSKKKIATDKIDKFFEVLSTNPNVTKAANAADISRRSIYTWLADDPEFAKKFNFHLEMGYAAFEDHGISLAMGETLATKGNVTMTIFMLKMMFPKKYMERSETQSNVLVLEASPTDATNTTTDLEPS